MKKVTAAFVAIFLLSAPVFAKDYFMNSNNDENKTEILISPDSGITLSGYGAPSIGFSSINGNPAVFWGGRAGVIVNGKKNGFAFGLAGYTMCYPTDRKDVTGNDYSGEFDRVLINYSGFLTEYHYMPQSLVHFSAGILIGGGRYCFYNSDYDYNENDSFFIIEPEIAGYLNVAKFFRIGASVSVKLPYGMNADHFSDSDFRNVEGRLLFEFGWF